MRVGAAMEPQALDSTQAHEQAFTPQLIGAWQALDRGAWEEARPRFEAALSEEELRRRWRDWGRQPGGWRTPRGARFAGASLSPLPRAE